MAAQHDPRIDRDSRDTVRISETALRQCNGDWSIFTPSICRAGEREGDPNNWIGRANGPHYYNNKYKSKVPDTPGVYELATTDERDNIEVVYVGESSNLHDRLGKYMSNGDHLEAYINRELRNGNVISHRYRKTNGRTLQNMPASRYVERDLLEKYNYPWNNKK